MTGTLRGSLYGITRADLVKQAEAKAATYFGTECVEVTLENERPAGGLSGFNAFFAATVWHAIERRTYGPDQCRKCGRDSWPHAPLNEPTRRTATVK